MKELSKIACAVRPSTTLAIDSKAKQMKAEGLDVMSFGTGEPDFDTPKNIGDAGKLAIDEGKTRYTPAAGIIPLRKAISSELKNEFGLDYDYTQIIIASGAKHVLYIALRALLEAGDEVVIPAPYWVSYSEMVSICGAMPVCVRTAEEDGFLMTAAQLEAAVTDRTKVLILNSPCNPSGMLYCRKQLEEIAEVCEKHDLYIISDEIYCKLVYGGREFTSLPTLGESIKQRTVLVNGVSKSYAMTGWRIGFAAVNPQIAKVMSAYLSHSTGAPSTVSQWAALEAYTGPQESIESMRKVFEQRRNYMVSRMQAMDGVSCLVPDGAFYVMMNISGLLGRELGGKLIANDDDFAIAFLDSELVAVVPCSGFGCPNYVRWTYAASMETITEGLDRLERFLHCEC